MMFNGFALAFFVWALKGLGGDQADLEYAQIFVGIVPAFYIFGIYRLWLATIETFPSTFYYSMHELTPYSAEPAIEELHPQLQPVTNFVFGALYVIVAIAGVLLSAWLKLPINPPAPPSWS
jgi:hypothetical protein